MSMENQSTSILDFGRKFGGFVGVGARSNRQEAVRLPEFRRPGTGRRPQDVVGLLLTHQARTRRSMRPVCEIKLRVLNPEGRPAVEFGF
ncbi:MAG: hypothetical protein R3D02_12230 [Hyphomicrobiales bacterium]